MTRQQRLESDIAAVRRASQPLTGPDDLGPLMERISDARYVLLGEASHGTSEYYTWRARLTQRLIREKGFSFVAVESDWPDCYAVNRYVKGYEDAGSDAPHVLRTFRRWPTWMWANWEVLALTGWLKRHNAALPDEAKVGFYGTDMTAAGMLSVGQLVREQHADDGVVLVGFGSYQGSVIAGNSWGAPRKRMAVPPAKPGSWEEVFHCAGRENALLVTETLPHEMTVRDHRAIGVVYHPTGERGYVPTSLAGRYDAFLYLDETEARWPLHAEPHPELHPGLHTDEPGVPETYPWGP